MYEPTSLELSFQQLQAVKQKYWGINPPNQYGDVRLLGISSGSSLVHDHFSAQTSESQIVSLSDFVA